MENGEEHPHEAAEGGGDANFLPDLGLPSDETLNHANQEDVSVPKSGGEAPLSFRRFLENAGSGLGPAGGVSMGLGRPDVAAGLPDFVQDHLVVEQEVQEGRDRRRHQAPPPDVSPPLASPPPTGARRKIPSASVASVRVSPGAASAPPSAPSTQPQGLPDFLSDGPMGSLHTAGDSGAANGGLQYHPRLQGETDPQRAERLERENGALRRDIERLQRQLECERRRVRSLQQQLEAVPSGGAPGDGSEAGRLQEEVRLLRRENAELRRTARHSDTARQTARQLVSAASGAEQLISQLMAGVQNLRTIAATLDVSSGPEDQFSAPEDGGADGWAAGGAPC